MFPISLGQYEANGDVYPRRFVVPTAGTNNRVDQGTGVTLPLLGVTGDNTRFPPNSPSDDGKHAIAGEFVDLHGPGQVTNLDLGANVTDLSVPLTSDGSGKGTPVSFAGGQTSLTWIGALPLKLGSSGEWIPVYILSPFCVHPALS